MCLLTFGQIFSPRRWNCKGIRARAFWIGHRLSARANSQLNQAGKGTASSDSEEVIGVTTKPDHKPGDIANDTMKI
jgi:hypothetical protein